MIVATGSKFPDEQARTTEFYDIAWDEWIEGPKMRTSWHCHSSVIIDDKFLYVIGGRDSSNK